MPAQSDATVRRNFTLLALDGVFFFFGMTFISYENIMPVMLRRLGASHALIILLPVIVNIGLNLPSIFVANRVEGMRLKKPYVLKVAVAQRVPWLGVGIIMILLGAIAPHVVIAAVLLSAFITASAGGFVVPAFFYLTAKTIPQRLRGRLFSVRSVGSYLLGMVGGVLVNRILATVAFPLDYGILFIVAFVLLMLCFLVMVFVVEPPAATVKPRAPIRDYLGRLPALLRANPSFTWFIVARMFFINAFATTAYFPVHLVQEFGLPDAATGIFTLITAGTFIVVNPVLGWLADRSGHKRNFVVANLAVGAGAILGLTSNYYPLSILMIALAAVARSVRLLSGFPMTMDFCREHEVPTYIGIVGLFLAPASLLSILTGVAAERFGLDALFAIAVGLSIVSLGIFLFLVPEPRSGSRSPTSRSAAGG